jgi:hypothetical protein
MNAQNPHEHYPRTPGTQHPPRPRPPAPKGSYDLHMSEAKTGQSNERFDHLPLKPRPQPAPKPKVRQDISGY